MNQENQSKNHQTSARVIDDETTIHHGESGEDVSPSGTVMTTTEETSSHGDFEDIEDMLTFDDMGLPEELLRGIYSHGFEKPSAIQQRAIRPIMSGRDLIAQAQSGTGKTATFSMGTLSKIDPCLPQGNLPNRPSMS